MGFTSEEIERMTPAVREEIQDWVARTYLAKTVSRNPERRQSKKAVETPVPVVEQPTKRAYSRTWPHSIWHQHDYQARERRRLRALNSAA